MVALKNICVDSPSSSPALFLFSADRMGGASRLWFGYFFKHTQKKKHPVGAADVGNPGGMSGGIRASLSARRAGAVSRATDR